MKEGQLPQANEFSKVWHNVTIHHELVYSNSSQWGTSAKSFDNVEQSSASGLLRDESDCLNIPP